MIKLMNIIDEENNEGKYEVFFRFESKNTKDNYILYTDYNKDDSGKIIIQAGKYEKIDENTLRVDRNMTKEEFEMISQIMSKMIDLASEDNEEKND